MPHFELKPVIHSYRIWIKLLSFFVLSPYKHFSISLARNKVLFASYFWQCRLSLMSGTLRARVYPHYSQK